MQIDLTENDYRYIKLLLISKGGNHNNYIANKIEFEPFKRNTKKKTDYINLKQRLEKRANKI